ncbi:MAG: hypothetical protein UT64_C0037G0010 [Candidatus Falkowbacteria bacterium GW2011_GWF2_39_8]|uniref:Uncharacterized protein n=1 Tax=Candidatus Falkowbacteria bacterium GW2011_GWF2_39_8 TaxID=1618642 RepID=A0A0G0Q4L4_9BACT|nr:MAG: hypothetical protein UT64_C0037G0010 [Candidatus Falkowbacteria bacterium GW2011_GWF2_39_8]
MFDYLLKFKELPRELREKFSSPVVMQAINELEKKYQVNLATLVIKVAVKEIVVGQLADFFIKDFSLEKARADALVEELKGNVFFDVKGYLNIAPAFKTTTDVVRASKAQVVNLKKSEDEEEVEELARELKALPLKSKAMQTTHDILPSLIKPKSENEIDVTELADELKHFSKNNPVAEEPKLNQVVPIKASVPKGAGFFFSAEDEEEIRKLTEKAIENSGDNSVKDADLKVDQIISMVKMNFSSEAMSVRFRQILTTYIKGIRGKVETRLTLSKKYQEGGLGLDGQAVERILSLADSVKVSAPVNVQAPIKFAVPEDELVKKKLEILKDMGARDFEYDLAREIKKREETKTKAAPIVVKEEVAVEKIPVAEVVGPNKISSEKTESSWDRIAMRKPLEAGTKIKIEDVKISPKIMGPIEELKYLDLVNFRRLDPEPARACQRILDKIKLLEQEQYSKRLEGIKAWRLNPVNQLYLNIGELAISENKPVDIIIEEKRSAGQDYLNSDEFEAIMNLNKQMRF